MPFRKQDSKCKTKIKTETLTFKTDQTKTLGQKSKTETVTFETKTKPLGPETKIVFHMLQDKAVTLLTFKTNKQTQ